MHFHYLGLLGCNRSKGVDAVANTVIKKSVTYLINLKQVGNPYLVRVGNIKVKVRFANNGVTFEDAFEDMLMNM